MTGSAESKFFDLHVTGLGYLNRVREVKPERGGQPFLACTIAALNGPTEAPNKLYFDVTVRGSDAQVVIRRCMDAVKANRKVLIGFRIGDPWFRIFKYEAGKKAGQTAVSPKGRLLSVSWVKIDGQQVYPDAADSKASDGSPTSQAASDPSSTAESSSALAA